MKAIITDNQWIWFENITDAEDEILWVEFSVQRPGAYVDPSQRGNWDGIYRKYNRGKQRMARPLLSYLRGVCKKHDLPLVVKDVRPKWDYKPLKPEEITPDFLPGITLDPHQVRGIQAACRAECGIADIPTGGGKGEIIAGICKAISCPTVVIADQRIVVDQLKARLELRDVADEIGLFYAGEKPNGEMIIVGTIQSLAVPTKPPEVPNRSVKDTDESYQKRLDKWEIHFKGYKTRRTNAKRLQRYIKDAEMILVDECVHEDTFINLKDGIRTAGSLYSDIKIMGVSPIVSVGGVGYKILDASEKYDDTLRIVTERGRSLISSHNHPYALFVDGHREDVYAKLLKKGSLLLVNNSSPPPMPFSSFWHFIGLFIGDGHLQNNRQIKFGVRKDFDDWEHVLRNIAVDFDAEYSSSINNRGDLVVRLKSYGLVDEIKSLGFEPGRKMGSINPTFDIPNNSAIVSILSGLFDAEGCSYEDHINFDSSDKPLAEFVQILLSSLGIKSSLYVGNKRNNRKHAIGWRVSITGSDVASFYNLVGFKFNRKHKRTIVRMEGARYIDPSRYLKVWLDTIPAIKLASILGCHHTKFAASNDCKVSLQTLIEWQNRVIAASKVKIDYESAKRIYGVSHSKIGNFCGVSTSTSWNRSKDGNHDLTHEYVSDIQQQLSNQLIDNNLEGLAVEPVDVVESFGKHRLIDFTVDKISSFEANGIVVHNCDKATSDPFKLLFRHWFKGRRRYGFCLSGSTVIKTPCGDRELSSFQDGESIVLLSEGGVFQHGTVIRTGLRDAYEINVDGLLLIGSADHLLAKDDGGYVRIADVVPSQRIKIEDDRFIEKFESFIGLFSMVDSGLDFGDVAWSGFEFSRPDLEQKIIRAKIDDIFSNSLEFILDSRSLGLKPDAIPIEKLHEQKFIRGGVVQQSAVTTQIISCLELSRKLQSTTAITFGECVTDLLSDCGVINRVSTEFLSKDFFPLFNSPLHLKTDGDTVSIYHYSLDSCNQFICFHRMINTIFRNASLPPLRLIVERFTSIPLSFDGLCGFLVLRDGKPILNAVLFDHFLLISVVSSSSSLDDMWELVDTIRTQVLSEFSDLIAWSIDRALKNSLAIITTNCDDIMIPRLAVIPFSFDDHLSSSNGAPYYLCQKGVPFKNKRFIGSVEMYDVVNVSETSNFIANSILVHNSGTPFDPDKPVEGLVMQEHLGSVIVKESRQELQRIGRIIPVDYFMLAFGLEGDIHDAAAYDIAYDEWITSNGKFHKLIAGLCKKYQGDGTLILVDREALGLALEAEIRKQGLTAHFIYGKTAKRRRNERLREFENREFDVLIGGKIINRGLDLAGGCENLIVATGGKLQSGFIQQIGRAVRHNKRGRSRIFDFYFRCNKYLYDHSRARLKAMIATGYDTTVIFPGGSVDGKSLVKSRFRIKKGLIPKSG